MNDFGCRIIVLDISINKYIQYHIIFWFMVNTGWFLQLYDLAPILRNVITANKNNFEDKRCRE